MGAASIKTPMESQCGSQCPPISRIAPAKPEMYPYASQRRLLLARSCSAMQVSNRMIKMPLALPANRSLTVAARIDSTATPIRAATVRERSPGERLFSRKAPALCIHLRSDGQARRPVLLFDHGAVDRSEE